MCVQRYTSVVTVPVKSDQLRRVLNYTNGREDCHWCHVVSVPRPCPNQLHILGYNLHRRVYVTIIWAPGPILATSRLPSSPHDNCGRSLHCLRCYVITFSPCLKLNVSLKSPSANIYYNGWYQCNSPLCQLALGGRFWALKYLRELRSGRDDHIQIPQVYCCTLLQCAEASAWLMQWLAVHSRKGQTWVWVWTPERERERERERESFASTPWCWSHDVTT